MNSGWLLLVFSVAALSGCAIGQSDFSCKGIPEGTQCHNAREVLEASKQTDGSVTNDAFQKPKRRDSNDTGASGVTPADGRARAVTADFVPEEENGALPLRTPSRVMRIWYAPWESESGDLQIAKIIYTEIEARRWTIGGGSAPILVKDLTPLEPASPARKAAAAPKAAAAAGLPPAPIVPFGTRAADSTAASKP